MKKIMFDDKYGLTKAVLDGRKTMTRRIVEEMAGREYKKLPQIQEDCNDGSFLVFKDADDLEPIILYPKYKVGEVVAVAQCLRDMGYDPRDTKHRSGEIWGLDHAVAWTNKMFVTASECIHKIRITAVRVERLQDISDEDCFREGIFRFNLHHHERYAYTVRRKIGDDETIVEFKPFDTPREAFSSLIDKLSGKGTWESNPLVYVYEFELVK